MSRLWDDEQVEWLTRPAQRRRTGNPAGRRKNGAERPGARRPGDAPVPRLPRPPASVRLGPGAGDAAEAAPVIGWPHLLVNGSDAAFRRMVRGLAGLVRRLETVHDIAAGGAGLGGSQLDFLLAVADADGGDGVKLTALSRRLDMSSDYASQVSTALVGKGLLAKWADPADAKRRIIALTAAGRAAAADAAPLIEGAYNIAFAPLRARDFAAFRRIAAKLDNASAVAVDILARRMGEGPPATIRDLRAAMKRLHGGR